MAYIPDLAIERSHEVSPTAFRLYAYFCKRRNCDGVCWPSLKNIATELRLAYSFASETRKQLIQQGWILFDGRITTLLLGFGNPELVSEKPNVCSEIPNSTPVTNSEIPNVNSGKPNLNSEIPNNGFGNPELHHMNHPKEPTQLTNPINQQGKSPEIAGVGEIFEHWKLRLEHPTAKLTDGRKAKVKARLNEGYTLEEIKQAIDGCAMSHFHRGQNPTGAVYDDLELICRNGEKLEGFKAKAKKGITHLGEPDIYASNRGRLLTAITSVDEDICKTSREDAQRFLLAHGRIKPDFDLNPGDAVEAMASLFQEFWEDELDYGKKPSLTGVAKVWGDFQAWAAKETEEANGTS